MLPSVPGWMIGLALFVLPAFQKMLDHLPTLPGNRERAAARAEQKANAKALAKIAERLQRPMTDCALARDRSEALTRLLCDVQAQTVEVQQILREEWRPFRKQMMAWHFEKTDPETGRPLGYPDQALLRRTADGVDALQSALQQLANVLSTQ